MHWVDGSMWCMRTVVAAVALHTRWSRWVHEGFVWQGGGGTPSIEWTDVSHVSSWQSGTAH